MNRAFSSTHCRRKVVRAGQGREGKGVCVCVCVCVCAHEWFTDLAELVEQRAEG